MSEKKITVRLKKLHCYQNDEHKYDDVYLLHKGKQIWPTSKRHEDVSIGTYEMMIDLHGIAPMEEVVIEIWDRDTFSPNDLYGKATFFPDYPKNVSYTVDMVPSTDRDIARYSIDWEVIA